MLLFRHYRKDILILKRAVISLFNEVYKPFGKTIWGGQFLYCDEPPKKLKIWETLDTAISDDKNKIHTYYTACCS